MSFTKSVSVLAVVGFLFACPKKEEPAQADPHKAAHPAPTGALPPGHPPMPNTEHAENGKAFSGSIKLGEGFSEKDLKDSDVLFIMARESKGDGSQGRLVAVQRHGKIAYPFQYELGPNDLMVAGMPFSGPFSVYARLDRDGDPMTKGEDDLYATFETPVNSGQKDVHLVLEKKKADSAAP